MIFLDYFLKKSVFVSVVNLHFECVVIVAFAERLDRFARQLK